MTLRIILGIVIIAAAIEIGVFVNGYISQNFAADALTYQIQSSNQNLAVLADKTKAINADISENNTQAEKLKAAISIASDYLPADKTSSTDIIRKLLDLSQQNRVSIIPLTIQDWSPVKTAESAYQILTITIEAQGTKENLTQFIKQVSEFNGTIVIENVTLKMLPERNVENTPSLPSPVLTKDLQYTASFKLDMFAK